MPVTDVTTTKQKFIVVVSAVTAVTTPVTNIYRRSQRGYRFNYNCHKNSSFRMRQKRFFKITQNEI